MKKQNENVRSSRKYNLPTFQSDKVVLVEGSDEFHFLRFLCEEVSFQIHIYEGKDQLSKELQLVRNVEGWDKVRRVAIIRDADEDPNASLKSVLAQWSIASGKQATSVKSDEWFTDEEGRSWSVWIMPHPERTGDLEELLWQAVPESKHRDCIDVLMQCLETCTPPPIRSRTKARLYAWLSTQKEPVKELYHAFGSNASIFNSSEVAFERFNALVRAL